MNEQTPVPPMPPMIPAAGSPLFPPDSVPLGSNSIEREPVAGVVGAIEAILRQPRRVMYQLKQPGAGGLIVSLLLVALFCSVVYGVVAGTFSGGQQLWAAPVKIGVGLFISALICLPSLYIFSCLGGSQARLAEVFGLVAGLLALMTVLLIGFAPVAWVFSQSTKSTVAMGGLHLAFWLVATIFGVRFLNAGFRHFSSQSDAGLRVWVVIFLLVALQMTTALRPIIGKSDHFLPSAVDKQFFVTHWMNCINSEQDTNTPEGDVVK
ncbi:MAG TPA: hypothetical protein VN048_09115 [Verrucomicrobiae bacterium]|nr:hypothetical protein [Verrucomicrobiae bacterium]